MKRVINSNELVKFTFRFYFKDGNQKLIEAVNIFDALSYVLFEQHYDSVDIYKIEEVQ